MRRGVVGQPILAAAAFQAALSDHERTLALGERRLKAGCSQDWLPHKFAGFQQQQQGGALCP
jgi:hypothetical protein